MEETTIYKLKYLVLPDFIFEDSKLSALQMKMAAFIYTYSGDKFFFSNTKLAKMFNVTETSISTSISKLEELKYISTSYEVKAGGGQIRFITRLKDVLKSDFKQSYSQTLSSLNGKDNKIKDNKEKGNNIYQDIFDHYLKCSNKNPNQYRLLDSRINKIKTRLKTFSADDIKKAITNATTDIFYSGNNDRGWTATLDWIVDNDEHLERMVNLVPKTQSKPKQFEAENLSKYDKYARN